MQWITTPNPVPGERAIAISPRPRTELPDLWQRRLRFHAGKHLGKRALELEQEYHAQRLSLLGSGIGDGIRFGLELTATEAPDPVVDQGGVGEDVWVLNVTPGAGTAVGGEDVVVVNTLQVAVSRLPLWHEGELVDNRPPTGLGMVVLRPALVEGADQELLGKICDGDDQSLGYVDRRLVDAGLLIFVPWNEIFESTPVSGDLQRNTAAWQVFAAERDMALHPAARFGIPLGMLALTDEGLVQFCDRHVGYRQLATRWDKRLDLAQIAHFQGHLADAGPNVDITVLSDVMATIPPAGLLPVDTMDWDTRTCSILPARMHLSAVPIVEDELDALLERSSGLDPIEVGQHEQLLVAVPVPAIHYDADLLQIAAEDPTFAESEANLVLERADLLGRRLSLRTMASSVVGLMDRDEVPVFANPDPDAMIDETGEEPAKDDETDFADRATTIGAEFTAKASGSDTWVSDLVQPYLSPTGGGIEDLIDDLDIHANKADDTVDLLFTRLRTDIHRLRQILQDSVEAARLGTSPVLHEITQGLTTKASPESLKNYFSGLTPTMTKIMALEVERSNEPPAAFSSLPVDAVRLFARARSREAAEATEVAEAEPINRIDMASIGGRLAMLGRVNTDVDVVRTFDLPKLKDDAFSAAPIVGKVIDPRTKRLTDRLREPPAAEAKNHAVATKHRVFSAIAELPIFVDDLMLPVGTADTALIEKQLLKNWADDTANNSAWGVIADRARIHNDFAAVFLGDLSSGEIDAIGAENLAWLRSFTQRSFPAAMFKDSDLANRILAGVFDADPRNGAESDFLAVAVAAEESSVAALRLVEGRIQRYQTIIRHAKRALVELQRNAQLWRTRLTAVDDDLAETRHDLGVVRSLRAEEQARVQALNTKRRRILEEEVRQLAFVRPRHVDLLDQPVGVTLQEVFVDPVAPAISADLEVPEEMDPIIELLREIPLGWFSGLEGILDRMDRLERLRALFERARERSRFMVAKPIRSFRVTRSSPAKAALLHMAQVADGVREHLLRQRSQVSMASLSRLSWRATKKQALETLSLEDLLTSGRGRAYLSRRARQVLDHFESVLAAIHQEITLTPAILRMRWVERLSIHDAPMDLRQLSVLPGYAELPYAQRRRLGELVQWLFAQVDKDEKRAVAVVNDAVRSAILVAGHAPAGELAQGHVRTPTRIQVGDLVEVTVETGRVRVGMPLTIHHGHKLVAAEVSDLAAESVRVRITRTPQPVLELAAGSRIAFMDRLRG